MAFLLVKSTFTHGWEWRGATIVALFQLGLITDLMATIKKEISPEMNDIPAYEHTRAFAWFRKQSRAPALLRAGY